MFSEVTSFVTPVTWYDVAVGKYVASYWCGELRKRQTGLASAR